MTTLPISSPSFRPYGSDNPRRRRTVLHQDDFALTGLTTRRDELGGAMTTLANRDRHPHFLGYETPQLPCRSETLTEVDTAFAALTQWSHSG
jgi:hypothetical protein